MNKSTKPKEILKKINTIEKILARLTKKRSQRIQISKIRKKGSPKNFTEIKGL